MLGELEKLHSDCKTYTNTNAALESKDIVFQVVAFKFYSLLLLLLLLMHLFGFQHLVIDFLFQSSILLLSLKFLFVFCYIFLLPHL